MREEMSLRCIFVVCLNSNKLLYYNLFRTVETRWVKQHREYSDITLPDNEELVQSLLNELGILNFSTFQFSRDSCKKNFHAPLFWVPYTQSSSHFWPVLIVECKNRLLCGIPFIENIHPFENLPSLTASRSAEIAIALEVLQSLVHYAELPIPKLCKELKSRILQHLPFGRPIHHWNPPIGLQVTPNRTLLWPRSKSKLELKVIEELKLSISGDVKACELNGTATFSIETDSNLRGLRLQLLFQKMKDFPEILYHSCVSPECEKDAFKMSIKYLPDKSFTLLYYNFKLSTPPIEAFLRIRNIDERRKLVNIQLYLDETMKMLGFTRLEVRMPVPEGNRITQITSFSTNSIGSVSLLRDGTSLSWSIISPSSASATSSTLSKIKDDLLLKAEVQLEQPNISLQNSFVTVMFLSSGATLSDPKFILHQAADFKLSQSSIFKSGLHYRSWNDQIEENIV